MNGVDILEFHVTDDYNQSLWCINVLILLCQNGTSKFYMVLFNIACVLFHIVKTISEVSHFPCHILI